MYAQIEKPKVNANKKVTNSVGQKKSYEKQGCRFVNNRTNSLVQRASFNNRGNQENTNPLKYTDLVAILRESKEHLDIDTLRSLEEALEKDLVQEPPDTATTIQQKNFLLVLIQEGLIEIECDRLLLDVRILNITQRLKNLENPDKITAKEEINTVKNEINTVKNEIEKKLQREGLGATQFFLNHLISALDHAHSTDQVIACMMKFKLLDVESKVGDREESIPNIARATINTNLGNQDLMSVSGMERKCLKGNMKQMQDPVLLNMADKLISPSAQGGRYSAKAEEFFRENTYLLEHTRHLDSEVQILDYFLMHIVKVSDISKLILDTEFDAVLSPQQRNSVHGVILVHSDRTPCLSCGTIIDIFRKDFPNIHVYITFRRDYGAHMKGNFKQALMGGTKFQFLFLKSLDEGGQMLNPENRSTDAEHKDKENKREQEQRDSEERERQEKLKAKKVKNDVRDNKINEASLFLQANLHELTKNEKKAYDTYVDNTAFTNMDKLLKAIASCKNDTARLQAIKNYLKGFPK